MSADAQPDELRERQAVVRSLALVAGLALLLAAGSLAVSLVDDGEERIESMRRCLERERGFDVSEPPTGDPSLAADGGAYRSSVDGNVVTFAIAGSQRAAARLVASSHRALEAPPAPFQLERRGDVVLRWDRPPSPAQRQALYDCTY